MWGVGSSTFYKMAVKEDGSPNWVGISILATTFLVIFVWRCCVIVPENWVAVRKRFGKVVRNKAGLPKEYDPLGALGEDGLPGKRSKGLKLRFYLVNSIHLVDCGDNETSLTINSITFCGIEYETDFSAAWAVSRRRGCPTKSFLQPGGDDKKKENDDLERLVRRYVSDAVVRAYEELEKMPRVGPVERLPLLDFEEDLREVREFLFQWYGVAFSGLLYGQRSVSPAYRKLMGDREIAAAQNNIAESIEDAIVTLGSLSEVASRKLA